MCCAGLIVAGGRGRRFGGDVPKQLALLAGRPLLVHAAAALRRVPAISELVVVVPAELRRRCEALLATHGLADVVCVDGGAERVDSVAAGLRAVPQSCDLVAIHDAARPLVDATLVERVIAAALRCGAAIPALRAHDTVKLASSAEDGASIERTVERQRVWLAQTPQVFRRELLASALSTWRAAGRPPITDDAQLVERAGGTVELVAGDAKNFKITVPGDLERAERQLAGGPEFASKGRRGPQEQRCGIGYDVHRLVAGRPLILGGVHIHHELGLDGHSDADVLAHAIGDALLGAAGLGDLGQHFPPDDPRFSGVDSLDLLRQIVALLAAEGLAAHYVDSVVLCEAPKLAPHVAEMRSRLATALGLVPGRVSVKATTTEGLGFTGRGEGIAAQATALVCRDPLL